MDRDTFTGHDTILVGVSGSGQDGVDGARGGGVLRAIHTIRIIRTIRHPLSSNNSLRYMSSLPHSQRNRVIGITAPIPRGTILMLNSVLRAG